MTEVAATSPRVEDQRSWVTLTRVLIGTAGVGIVGVVLGVRLARKAPGIDEEDGWLLALLVVGLVDVVAGTALVRRLGHRRLAACLLVVGIAAVIAVTVATTADLRPFRGLSARDSWAHALATGVLIALVPWELVRGERRRGFEVVWWSTAVLVGLTVAGYAIGASKPSLDVVDVTTALLSISATAAVVRLVVHWWREDRTTGDPLAGWMVAGAVVAWLAVVPRWFDVIPEFAGDGVVGPALLLATLPLLVVGITVRAMRERPGRFHGIAHEVIGWIVLSAAIVLLYTGVVVVLGQFASGRGRTSVLVATTCLLAIGVEPGRRRIQASVDRLIWGARNDPLDVVRGVIEHVSADSVDELLPSVVDSLRSELRLDSVAIDVFADGAWSRVASSGLDATTYRRVVDLRQHDALIGRLTVGWEHGPHLRRRDEHVLDEIAASLSVAVGWVRLVDELRRSSAAVVTAREEERRRLSRDFHDGLGPALTGVSLGVRAAMSMLARDDREAAVEQTRILLTHAADEVDALVAEVRRIARDLRPTTLDQLGLVDAIKAFTKRFDGEVAFHVSLPAPATELPAAVEVAAYRIVTEAVTNVVRHSRAAQCWLKMTVDSEVAIEITDDGVGVAEVDGTGVGLAAMRERATELGGRVVVRRVVPHGTSVGVHLPVGPT